MGFRFHCFKLKINDIQMSNTVSDNNTNTNERLFAVYRSGIRVSDSVYPSERDPQAVYEKRYWEDILNRYPDGTKISIKEIHWRK